MTAIATLQTLDWPTFVARHWDRRPVLFKAAAFSAGSVFDAAVGAAHAYARRTHALEEQPLVQVTVERHQQTFLAPFLPRSSDGSLAGYQARMRRKLGARRYAFLVSQFHAFGFPLWLEARSFFAGLWEQIGLPITGAITTLFHGNYEHSPVGAHLDRFATFMFAIQGKKRMRFWARRPWKGAMTTCLDYAPYLAKSFVAEVEPGDVLYWPSRYYHVGESVDGDVATSVNIGVPRTGQRSAYYLRDLLQSREEAEVSPGAWSERLTATRTSALARGALVGDRLARELPPALASALGDLRRTSAAAPTRDHIRALWLDRATAGGFDPAPPPSQAHPRPLGARDTVRADPRFPILWFGGPSGVVCSANGHRQHVDGDRRGLARMFRALGSGKAVGVAELAQMGEPREIRTLLRRFESVRAIQRVAREG